MTNPHPPSLQTALKGNIIHSTFVVDALRLLTGGLVLHANQSEAGSNAAVNEENQTMLCMAFSPVNGRKLDDNIGSTTGNLLREQGAVFPIIVLRTFTQTGTSLGCRPNRSAFFTCHGLTISLLTLTASIAHVMQDTCWHDFGARDGRSSAIASSCAPARHDLLAWPVGSVLPRQRGLSGGLPC
eukprot:1158831-Pelagomonas_calceolata.AAC.10